MNKRLVYFASALILSCGLPGKGLYAQDWLAALSSPAVTSLCPIEAPTGLDPVGTVYDTTRPTFAWTTVPSAKSYTLYVQYAGGGEVVQRWIGIVPTAFTADVDLPLDVDLQWKVKGEAKGCTAGPYSTPLQFLLRNSPPPPNSDCPNLACFPNQGACESACIDGTCERRINCGGATAYKCFC